MNIHATMNQVFKAKQALAKKQADDRECESALRQLSFGQKPRVRHAVAKRLLLESPCWYEGKVINVFSKSVGAGVYELRAE